MIKEDYVSFEIAKLLKEKGFNEPTLAYAYGQDMVAYYSQPRVTDDYNVESGRYPLPTLQMAIKWLREIHNIAIDTEWEHSWYAYVKPMTANPFEDDHYQCISIKYEEACEAAILYCLENLI